ncbi:hypothetical protein KCV01_g4047, partial [Aureobasidium melanogenum]
VAKTNAAGITTVMDHDANGNVTAVRNTLTDTKAGSRQQVVTITYDAANHEVSRTTTLGDVTGVTRITRYNAFGEVTGRGVGSTYQETTDYDLAGRVLRTNAEQGRPKIYLYDGNGNATLAMESQTSDLMNVDLLSSVGATNLSTLFATPVLAWTLTVYDAKNQVVDVIQPTMDINSAYLGLQAQQVPGGAPGQINVDVGGPVGPNPELPGIDGANLLGTVVGGSLGTVSANMRFEHAGGWTNPPTSMMFNIDVPDLSSAFGAYDLTISTGSKTFVLAGPPHSARNVSVPIPGIAGTWGPNGGSAAYTLSIYVTPRSTGQQQLIAQAYSGVGTVSFAKSPMNGYVAGGGPPDISLPINLGSPKLKLSPADSAEFNAGRFSGQVYIRPWGSSGAYTWFSPSGGTPATIDVGSLQAGAYYEVLYVAERPDGSLVRSEQYQLLAGNNPQITYGPYRSATNAYSPMGAGTFVITNNDLFAVDLRHANGNRMSHAYLYYRPLGSTGGYTGIGDTNFVWGGSKLSLAGIPAGNYDVVLWMYDGAGNAAQSVSGVMTLGGQPSISLNYPRPADNNITLKNLPSNATTANILFTNQRTGQQIGTGPLAITSPGSLSWAIPQGMFDASGVATNWTMTVTLADSRVQPQGSYTATGTITVGSGRSLNAYGVYVQGNVYSLSFNPLSATNQQIAAGQFLVLRYWQDGADIANHPELIQRRVIQKNGANLYQWDSVGLDPNVTYNYTYDVYATQAETQNEAAATSLARSNGRFQPKNAPGNQEVHWVVGGINNRQATVHRSQAWNAFGEIVSETDGNGHTTDLAYNTLGKLTTRTEAAVTITYANGYQALVRPTTQYFYDLAGRQVGVQDANGNVTTQSWNTALNKVATEFHADGGVISHQYDAVGNERARITALGAGLLGAASARRTDYTYDVLNRLVRADGPVINGQRSFDSYTYDEQDRRIAHTNTLGTDTVSYDVEGNVASVTSAGGRATTYTTVWNATANGGKGTWTQTTTLPGNAASAFAEDRTAHVLVDVRNSFGQALSHTDIAGRVTTYTYYNNGLLKQQGNSAYTYYNNGLVKTIVNNVTGIREQFEYDNNGNVTFDGLTNRNADWAFQQSVSTYDALNRLVKLADPRYTIDYEYDAVGNRIHMKSVYTDGLGKANQVQDYWYEYDRMNRFTVTMGQLSGARGTSQGDTSVHVVAGSGGDGINIGYNAFGERVSATYAYDNHNERYEYDAGGYLTVTTMRNASGAITGTATRTNDLAGRVTHYVETSGGTNVQDVTHVYDADSLVSKDIDNIETAKAGHEVGTLTDRLADGTVKATRTYGQATTVTTTYNYIWFDAAKQSEIKVQASNDAAPKWSPGLSAFTYDSEGRLVSAVDVAGQRAFRYQLDGEGRILQRDELLNAVMLDDHSITAGISNRSHSYYYMDGNQIGNVGNDGPERIDYARELAQHAAQVANKDDSHKRFTPVAFADFDANYQPINSSYPGTAPTSYIVHANDTLPGIAQAIWGDSSLWWMLADANNLTLDAALVPNTVLTVPNKVTNIHNNSSTVRPYDPGRAIGNTQPTLPDAPPPPAPKHQGGGCGGFLQIVAIVVAVVATIYTAGAAAGLFGIGAGGFAGGAAVLAGGEGIGAAIGFGALGGAVGSIAAQGVMIAGGEQNGINWKGVALGAVGGAAAGGAGFIPIGGGQTLGGLAGANSGLASAGAAVGQGAAAAAGSAVAGSVLGLQAFSWRDVAAGAVASAAGYGAGRLTTDWSTSAQRIAGGVASGAASAAVHGNLSQSWGQIASNVIGSTIGNTIADRLADLPAIKYDRVQADTVQFSADDLSITKLGPMAPLITPISLQRGPRVTFGQTQFELASNYAPSEQAALDQTSANEQANQQASLERDRVYADRLSTFEHDNAQNNALRSLFDRDATKLASLASPVGLWTFNTDETITSTLNPKLAGAKESAQMWLNDLTDSGRDDLKSTSLLTNIRGYYKQQAGFTLGFLDQLLQPGSMVEGELAVAGPIIGKGVGLVLNAARKVPYLGKVLYSDLGVLYSDAGAALKWGGRQAGDLVDASKSYISKWLSREPKTVPGVGTVQEVNIAGVSDTVPNKIEISDTSVASGGKSSPGWPGTGGSGPVPGVIAINDQTSVAALRNYYPKRGGIEFVYDPETNTFATGKPYSAGKVFSSQSAGNKLLYAVKHQGEMAEYFGMGVAKGIYDGLTPLGTFIGEEAARHSLGEYDKTALGRLGTFINEEAATGAPRTRAFFDAVKGTYEGIVDDPGQALREGAGYARETLSSAWGSLNSWFNNGTPQSLAEDVGHVAGEGISSYGVGKIGEGVMAGAGLFTRSG